MLTSCIKREHLENGIVKVAIDKAAEKYTRVEIWDIKPSEIKEMIDNLSLENMAIQDAGKIPSKKVKNKIENLLTNASKHSDFVKSITDKMFKDPESGRHQAMALKQVLDTISGELNKAVNYNVDIESIQNEDGIPYIPTSRLAASLGRQILYTKGFRVHKGNIKGKNKSKHVEHLYYLAGITALNQLEESGFITLHDKNTGKYSIQDYLTNKDKHLDYKNIVIDSVPVVELNAKALGAKESGANSKDPVLTQIRGLPGTTEPVYVKGSPFSSFKSVLDAINLVSVPLTVIFPFDSPNNVKTYHKDDYEVTGTAAEVRDTIQSKPVRLNKSLHGFFELVSKELEDSSETASQWLSDVITSKASLAKLFNIEPNTFVQSDRASGIGRKLSGTTPLDDLVDYFDGLGNSMYMPMFGGRNSRFYMDNTVVNPHSSKLMRHALAVDEYEISTKSDAFNFFVDKVAITLKHPTATNEELKEAILDVNFDSKNPIRKQIDDTLKVLKEFNTTKDVYAKIELMSKLYRNFGATDVAELITTLQAVQDIRDGLNNYDNVMKSTYMVSSDATASGGQLTLMQALGINPEGIKTLLTRLGVLKGASDEDIIDVYGILQEKIDEFINVESELDETLEEDGFSVYLRPMLKTIGDVLYNGDWREMSKYPTMTFIYDQSKTGAVVSISKDFTDRFIKAYKKPSNRKALNELLVELGFESDDMTKLVRDNTSFKKQLVQAFQNSTVPAYLYTTLQSSLESRYLRNYKKQAEDVFKLASSLESNNIKIFPASLVLDNASGKTDIAYTKENLEKYGVPLSKIMERANTVNSVNGGDIVLTREEMLRDTVMNVSSIHSADTANLVYSLDGLLEKYDSGVIVVHDDVRGRPDLVMEMEKQYIAANLNVAMNFDIHLEVLKSIAAYDNDLNSKEEYTKLKSKIEKALELKREILKDKTSGYNNETTSIIGDKPLSKPTGKPSSTTNTQEKVGSGEQASTTNESPQTNNKNDNVKTTSLELVLESYSKVSNIIKNFLSLKNKPSIKDGKPSFNSSYDTLTIDTALDNDSFVEQVEHEIVHSYTTAMIQDHYVNGNTNQDIAYIEKAINKLGNNLFNKSQIPNKAKDRIFYILSKSSPEERMAEMLSVMASEPEVAAAIYSSIDNSSNLKKVIKRIINRVMEVVKRATKADNLHDDVDIEQLYSSINAVISDGKSMRELEYDKFIELQKEFGKTLNFNEPNIPNEREVNNTLDKISYSVDYLNEAVAKHVVQVAQRKGESLVSHVDKLLKIHMPSYSRVVRRVNHFYDDSPALQQIMHKITNEGINKLKKNEVLSLFQKIADDKEVVKSKELQRFKLAAKNLSDSDKKSFEEFSSKMSLTDYFLHFPNGIKDVDKEIANMTKGNIFNSTQIHSIDMIVDMNVNDVITRSTPYNLHAAGMGKGGIKDNAQKLLVLKSIKAIGEDKFNSLVSNVDLMEVTRDNLIANANIISNSNGVIEIDQLKDNGMIDEFEESLTFKAITVNDLKYYDSNNDWKILREPTKEGPGIVYQKIIDNTFQSGVFTNIKMNSGDISVDSRFKGKKGVLTINGKNKLVLTSYEKSKLGVIKNPAQSITLTMTQNMAIQDSAVIREKLLQEDTYYSIEKSGTELLVKMVKDKNTENPWFLNDIDDRDFSKLHPSIRAKYTRVGNNISNVDGFDKRVKYVRKDISYWLVGASEKSIANNRTLQNAIRITKGIMSSTKIGMVILNPVKIAKDNIFNVVYLGTLGVDITQIGKEYVKISDEFNEYQKLKDRMQSLKVKSYAEKDGQGKYNTEINRLNEKMLNHPMRGVVERGFINSLGSDVVMQDDNPGSGFKSDIDKVLKTILHDNKGSNNALGRLIMKVANTPGLSMEGLLEIWSKPFSSFKSTKNIESELLKMSERVADIKSDGDVIAYMHQYLNSPNSEFVKLGSHMTDLTDVLAKETYYRYLVDTQKLDAKKAEIEVLKSFPDYKENLPTAIQRLDSVGILMFPQYWMRMIQAMYRLTENRPASFGSEVLLAELLGTKSQLWSQTIFDKAFSNWGIIHNPVNHVGVGSFVPTNVF